MWKILQILWRIIRWLRGGALKLLVIAGIILIIWGILSPLGTLVWWLSEGAEILGISRQPLKEIPNPPPNSRNSDLSCYIIFLTGVGDFSTDELTLGEEYFLNELVKEHPQCLAVKDVFPYSAANIGLGGKRLMAPFWESIYNAQGWLKNAGVLIQIRNLWRFAISLDQRYSTVYNQGIASAIVDRMNAMQPLPDRPLKIILLGTSGGVQVSLGAAPYLEKWLDTKITIVSVGGVFSGKTGFEVTQHFYHLQGERDWVEDIGQVVFPSRWYGNVTSAFNQARLQGRYTVQNTGPHTHDGETGYFGEEKLEKDDLTYVGLTLEVVNNLPLWQD